MASIPVAEGIHHGWGGHGHRRARALPPQTQHFARGVQRDFRRLCRQRHARRRSSLAKIPVHILGDDIPVRARIHTINGFSARADQAELLKWHGHTGAGRTFLTHGEEAAMQKFTSRLTNLQPSGAIPQIFRVPQGRLDWLLHSAPLRPAKKVGIVQRSSRACAERGLKSCSIVNACRELPMAALGQEPT